MRNLKLQFCNRVETKIPNVKFILTDSTGDKQKYNLFLVTTEKVYKTTEHFENIKELANIPDIIGADYLAITDELCLATDDGRILSVDTKTGEINENSYCDVGLVCMAWSPEQEVVAFITKTNNLVVMTCTYDPIAENALQIQCEKEQQFVNVGWGRKETQFHGSEGKNAAKQKTNFEKPTEVEDILAGIEISWRYDGAYFAVSFISEQFGRMFKVFDKEGILQYTSEKINGLQGPIAWRPSGNWIAIPQIFPNKSTIALFEKNGLRHREIVLPFSFEKEKICKLKWSTDSDILVIQTEVQETKTQHLYLYTIGNYHWYLKQNLSYKDGEHINAFEFDMDSALERTLHVILNNGSYMGYRWCFDVDKFERDGLVAVIDGNKLLLTNFSKAIIPPPMSATQISIENNINACAFYEDHIYGFLNLCLYDANGNFHLFKTLLTMPAKFEYVSKLQASEQLEINNIQHLANITFCSSNNIIATLNMNHDTNLVLITLNIEEKNFNITSTARHQGIVNVLHYNPKNKKLFTHTIDDNTIRSLEIYANNVIMRKSDEIQLPFSVTLFTTHYAYNKQKIISLCANQRLYIDEQHLMDDVTSFCLEGGNNGAYLAFTKHAELFLLRLTNNSIDDVRSIESGGKLIAICAESSRAVLQMPRGNLEAFYPRLLLLDRVGKMLDSHEYEKVMDLLVKQRINLNIICDHDMNNFVDNIPKFVDSITNVHWLNLFLSDLRNEDITKTMYANSYNNTPRTYPFDFQIENKIKFVCEKMLNYMENASDTERLILPIITAKVKMCNLQDALELIWHFKKQESSNIDSRKSLAEDALKYLLYLVDVNELFNVALGSYDFGLVLFVAQKSQKDPREFLPFLNELKELELNYRKFKIDEHLKRYEKALKNISQCNEAERFEEALSFIKLHQLYKLALQCYQNNEETYYKRICLAYADYLRVESKLDNASLMYERAGDMVQALRCASHVLDWQRVLTLAYQQDAENVAEVALSLVPALLEKRLNAEAFHLLYTYGNNFEDALDTLLKGNLYLKAIYEARLYQAKNKVNDDLIASHIKPSLESYIQLLDANLVENEHSFSDYKQRLLNIREQRQRLKDTGTYGDFGGEEKFDESDLLSDTTSMRSSHYTGSSRGTGKTFRSSKNRRKHERKHFSLKPGNPFEDIALIDALYGLINKIIEQQHHLHDTCKALLELKLDEKASKIQKRFKKLVTLIQSSLDEIWIPELAVGIQQTSTTVDANIDYKLFQNEQRYALLDPVKRFKPQFKLTDWEHPILT